MNREEIYQSNDYCKNCGSQILKDHKTSATWDGDTCSEECQQELSTLSEDLPWESYDDEDSAHYGSWAPEWIDEVEDYELIPEDDRET